MPRRLPKPTRCIVKRRSTDSNDGSRLWIVPAEKVGDATMAPEVDVWWSREPRQVINGKSVVAEHLLVKQKNKTSAGADLLILTPGQVYDLIDALNRAVESL